MDILLFAQWNNILNALPLIVAVSLVYAATRHEDFVAIARHAGRLGVWIIGFMAIVLVILQFLNWRVG